MEPIQWIGGPWIVQAKPMRPMGRQGAVQRRNQRRDSYCMRSSWGYFWQVSLDLDGSHQVFNPMHPHHAKGTVPCDRECSSNGGNEEHPGNEITETDRKESQ